LSLGGFRSENILNTYGPLDWNGVPAAWADAQHMNTMLSGNFSHIGAGVSQSGDSYYYAVDTAAVTSSGQQQEAASSVLTSVPSSGDAGISQFMVPVTLNTPNPEGNVFHKVQYGQSLWSIAIEYGTTIKNIQALNNLGEDSTVYQGQELLVMTGATQSALPTVEATLTLPVTETLMPTVAVVETIVPTQPTQTIAPIEEEKTSSKSTSSRLLVVILIVAAFVGAGMAVWLIRDPGN
ncbi:MAG: LysM peptidoglycan-binding domain-containing protein, partial [Anaerolineales bacterium]|nr:LysM peptidoglycan-binding domain-containing protein [Anaerolineales bacterium]